VVGGIQSEVTVRCVCYSHSTVPTALLELPVLGGALGAPHGCDGDWEVAWLDVTVGAALGDGTDQPTLPWEGRKCCFARDGVVWCGVVWCCIVKYKCCHRG
jgi:hypothetical protein